MKTILLCIVTSFLILSCSSDSELNLEQKEYLSTDKFQIPANIANPYDSKGKAIYEKLNLYYEEYKLPKSISELSQQIRFVANISDKKMSISGRLIEFTDEIVESIMDDPDNSMILIVQGSSMGTYAKTNLILFLQNLILQRDLEFDTTCSFITDYESEIVADTILTSEERETILTVASISRYSLYSAEERKDRDWETSVGSRPGKILFKGNEVSIITIIALLPHFM